MLNLWAGIEARPRIKREGGVTLRKSTQGKKPPL
jgi:hypothetical protein